MVAEPGRPGMDAVMQSFQMVGKVTAGMSSEKEKLEDEKQREEEGVVFFPAMLDNAADHVGSSSDSAGYLSYGCADENDESPG